MVKYFTYRIISELKINLEYYSGLTYLNDLIEVRNELIKEKSLNPEFNFIVDLRDANFDLHSNIVEEFISYVKFKTDLLWKRKTAILSHTPNQTAFSILYISDLGQVPMKVNSFSTLDSALKWVNLSPSDKPVIEQVIADIKHNILLKNNDKKDAEKGRGGT